MYQVYDKADVKEPIKAGAVTQEIKEEVKSGDLEVEKEAPSSGGSDAPAAEEKTKRSSSGWSLFDVKPKEQTSNLALAKPETVVVSATS